MELETLNRVYLELSKVATVKTKRELELEALLQSAHCIALRGGEGTHWKRFADSIRNAGVGSITPRTYRILESDLEEQDVPPSPQPDSTKDGGGVLRPE